MLNITFLGTSGSTPTKYRSLPGVALEYNGEIYLFDCGEGTQKQFFQYSLNISKINSIFITHIHGDHVIGIAGLVRTLALHGRTKPLCIYVPEGEEGKIKPLITFDGAKLNYPILINPVKTGVVAKGKGFTVSAFQLDHSIKTYGFVFKENDKLHFMKEKCKKLGMKGEDFSRLEKLRTITLNGKKIKLKDVTTVEEGKEVAYAVDTRPAKNTVKAARNADVLIHEATYIDKLKNLAVERKHSTALESARIAKSAKVKRLLLTHISARYRDPGELLKEAKTLFKNTQVAYDGMKVSV